MFNVWCALDIAMVAMLFPACRKCRRCRWFWGVQAFQLVQLFWILATGDEQNVYLFLFPNALLEVIAIYACCCFPLARAAMLVHLFFKINVWTSLEGQWWMLPSDRHVMYWLNNATILILMAYAVRNAIPRVKGALCQTIRKLPSTQTIHL